MMNWLVRRGAARLRRACAAGAMRCPDGRRLFREGENPPPRAERVARLEVPGGHALAWAFGREGFFAAFRAADGPAADALLRDIEARLRALGAARVTGPVSASPVDLNGGAAVGGARALPFGDALPAFAHEALRRRGWAVLSRSLLYELDPRALDWPRYERAAAYSTARFGYRVVSARALGDRAACAAIARLSHTDPRLAHTDEETAAMLRGLGRRWCRPLTRLALLDGEPVGCLIALRAGQTLRAATIQVRPDFRNRAVPAALALPLLRAANGRRVELGVIEAGNLASRLVVERAGARVAAEFLRYGKELT